MCQFSLLAHLCAFSVFFSSSLQWTTHFLIWRRGGTLYQFRMYLYAWNSHWKNFVISYRVAIGRRFLHFWESFFLRCVNSFKILRILLWLSIKSAAYCCSAFINRTSWEFETKAFDFINFCCAVLRRLILFYVFSFNLCDFICVFIILYQFLGKRILFRF